MQPSPGANAGGPRPPGRAFPRLSLPAWFAIASLTVLAVVLILTFAGQSGGGSPTARSTSGAPEPTSGRPLPGCGAVCDPIDPRYLTDVPFGRTSFWLQPWRAYLDTWPGARIEDAVGINFNVGAARAAAVARLLHDSGFRLARIEIGWDALSYGEPSHFVNEASLRTRLAALRRYGLRPLFVLNANSGGPCPARALTLETTAPAPAGATTVRLTRASAALVAPGRSGFNPGAFFGPVHRRRRPGAPPRLTPAQRIARKAANRAAHRAAIESGHTPLLLHATPDILITRLSADGVATLSHGLPTALPAGRHSGTTLEYAPFAAPRLPDGSPDPAFRATLRGWLGYVAKVAALARGFFGPGGYDLEVWNELTFGSQFLNVENYYGLTGHAARNASKAITKEVIQQVLAATVAYARSPVSGISPQVSITNGFASESPFPSGADAPAGLTALSKHPYVSARSFPAEYHVRSIRPVNALGLRDTPSRRSFTPSFIPTYQSLLPEYTLTATSTETLIRDLAPIETNIYGIPHGRDVGPHGVPVQKWITEYNLGSNATPMGPDGRTPEPSVTLTEADRAHFHAKALLRSLVAMVGKGVSREYFFAAAPGPLSLISKDFFSSLTDHPDVYPGDERGGEVMRAFATLLARLRGPGPAGPARQLRLTSIQQDGEHAQFAGDGTAAHPPLYDREVLAVLPFQTAPRRFIIPVYVMTRDLLTLYRPSDPSSDVTRFDLPDERFRLTLSNLPSSTAAPVVSAYDPLRQTATPARVLSHASGSAMIEVASTDYPRLLTIELP
jgi:hypothetical protein